MNDGAQRRRRRRRRRRSMRRKRSPRDFLAKLNVLTERVESC